MAFDPRQEPCTYCGREQDECICGLAPDFPMDFIAELDSDYLDWDYYQEEQPDEGDGQQDSRRASDDSQDD